MFKHIAAFIDPVHSRFDFIVLLGVRDGDVIGTYIEPYKIEGASRALRSLCSVYPYCLLYKDVFIVLREVYGEE